ncbi:hypothetical protein SAMN06265379_101806 [Saccharicrinis carchari]|uniref:Uncharacterized protein n=1 Tax=Saccharicrinis carchari TaxID=1168039 RepID=A0A521B9M4_SACCC|nr:hypothetical protein [Saccharicrinis carchari]SMO43721.1 hypothetical protein SAMN06265379_101806 [Saccharicrinis carchari]
MKKNDFLDLYDRSMPRNMLDLIDAVIETELFFNSQSLQFIYSSKQEMNAAINRAMHICRNMGLPLERHFRISYISDHSQHAVLQVWKMSKAAYYLTIINGDPDNPMVSRMQWELIKKML